MSEHELWNELGNLYFMSGTLKQAAYAYRRAIQLDGGFGRPYCNLALTYVKQGRFEEAVQLYHRSIELLVDETERAITWYRLGDVYRHMKDYRDAILAYQQADLLGAELSPDDRETDHILYGGAEVRLVQAGAVSPSIPESVSSPEAITSEPKTEASASAVDEIATPEPAVAEPVEVLSQSVEEVQEVSAPVDQAVSVDTAPSQEALALADEAASDTTSVQEDLAPIDEAAAETALVQEDLASVDEAAADTAPAEEFATLEFPAAPAEEDLETVLPVEEPAPQPEAQAAPVVDELPVVEEAKADSAPSIADAAGETAAVTEAVAPDLELQTSDLAAGAPAEEHPGTESSPVDMESVTIEEASLSTDEPADPAIDVVAMSTAEWEEYVVSSMEQETDVQLADPAKQALDESAPEVDMELPGAETEQPVEEPAILEQDPVFEDFPASAEVPPFSPLFPAGAEQSLVSEELLTAVPSLALDFREEETQPIFIVPEDIQEGFSVVQVESGTTDVACAVESEESDAEMQGILGEIERFKRAVQSNSRNAPAWDTLGTLYKAARKYREAIMAYQQAVSVDPSKPHYHHHLGILYAIEGREEEAIRAFQEVIEIDPNHSLANATLGGYYRKMGLEELAQKHIGKAMKNFYTSENEYNRACLEALCGNIEQSLELLRIALKNKQTYVDWVLRDPDLDSIRRDPRFKQLISDYATW